MNKKQLAAAYRMDIKTLNKIYQRHKAFIGEYEFRRWLPAQIQKWKSILGEFETESKKSTTGAT